MQWALPRRLACIAVFAVAAAGGLPALAQTSLDEADITRLVEGLRNGTLPPSLVSRECERGMVDDPGGEDLRQVMTTYLEVPRDLALSAFCDALVLAVKDGEITAASLVDMGRNGLDARTFLEVGRVLRTVYFYHLQTTTASAGNVRLR